MTIHPTAKDIMINGIIGILENYSTVIINKEHREITHNQISEEIAFLYNKEDINAKQIGNTLKQKNSRLFISRAYSAADNTPLDSINKILFSAKYNGFRLQNTEGIVAIVSTNKSFHPQRLVNVMEILYGKLHGNGQALFVHNEESTLCDNQTETLFLALEAQKR